MSLIKSLNDDVIVSENIFLDISCFFDEDGEILNESMQSFIFGAKHLLDNVTDKDTMLRFAKILAGLEYFRQKNVGSDERESIKDLLDDKKITEYVKKTGEQKAHEILDEILSYFEDGKVINRKAIDKMIEDIRKFYVSKKANVGPVLHVQAHEAFVAKQIKQFEEIIK